MVAPTGNSLAPWKLAPALVEDFLSCRWVFRFTIQPHEGGTLFFPAGFETMSRHAVHYGPHLLKILDRSPRWFWLWHLPMYLELLVLDFSDSFDCPVNEELLPEKVSALPCLS